MIRVDEIYNNTFWPWIRDNLPNTRMFFCDPPGHSGPEYVMNFSSSSTDSNYIWFHDQEPIHLDIHAQMFDAVEARNQDCNLGAGPFKTAVVTSEWHSEAVKEVCERYGWTPYYYFYHGWAALDWYRGYDKTFLIPNAVDRTIRKSFISPNRIIGGKRNHRVELMYHLIKAGVKNAHISFPDTCPGENQSILHIAERFVDRYPDIVSTFANAGLPYNFPNESGHPMHSCWLSLFKEHAESAVAVVTETVFSGNRNHLTEKSFKPIALQMPFVIASTAGSLRYLRHYGFKTFGHVWNEAYDDIQDDTQRLKAIADILVGLDNMSVRELNQVYKHCLPVVQYNYHHFYHGGFEQKLWTEFKIMLGKIKQEWR